MRILPRSRCTWLLLSLIMVIVFPGFVDNEGLSVGIGGLLLTITPLTGIWAVSDNRRHLAIGAVLAIPTVLLLLRLALRGPDAMPTPTEGSLVLVYYAVTTVLIFLNVLVKRRVTGDALISAASVYLLIGFTFGIAYSTIGRHIPEAFSADGPMELNRSIYFSFVTLTTLGYGDILPVSDKARALAILESLTGVLYLAFVIARMVSLYKRSQESE